MLPTAKHHPKNPPLRTTSESRTDEGSDEDSSEDSQSRSITSPRDVLRSDMQKPSQSQSATQRASHTVRRASTPSTAALKLPIQPRLQRDISTGSDGSASSEIDDFLTAQQQQQALRQQQRHASQNGSTNAHAATSRIDSLYTPGMTATEMLDAEDQFIKEATPLLKRLIASMVGKHVQMLSKQPNKLQQHNDENVATKNTNIQDVKSSQQQPRGPMQRQRSLRELTTRELEMLVKRAQLQQKQQQQQLASLQAERATLAKERGITLEQLAAEERLEQRHAAEEVERRAYAEKLAAVQLQAVASLQSQKSVAEESQSVSERYWNNIPAPACVLINALLHWRVIEPASQYSISQFGSLTRKERKRLDLDDTTDHAPPDLWSPRQWMVTALCNQLWQLTREAALNEGALCFLVNNGAMLVHLLNAYQRTADQSQSNGADKHENHSDEATATASASTATLTITVQPLTVPQLAITAKELNIQTPTQQALTHIRHWLSQTLSHLLRHAINTLSQNVRVSHLLPQAARVEDSHREQSALSVSELLMTQGTAVATLVETVDHIYQTMLAHHLLAPVAAQFTLLLIQHINIFLTNYMMSDPTTCTVETAMHLQIVSSALIGWSQIVNNAELAQQLPHFVQHIKQIALLLLSDKQALYERYKKYRVKAAKLKLQQQPARKLKFDQLSQYEPLNPVQIHYLLLHCSLINERQAVLNIEADSSTTPVNSHSTAASDVVPADLLNYIQKQARAYQRDHPTVQTKLADPNEDHALPSIQPFKAAATLLLEDEGSADHLLISTELTMDVSLQSTIGKFNIASVGVPHDLLVGSDAAAFKFLTANKRLLL